MLHSPCFLGAVHAGACIPAIFGQRNSQKQKDPCDIGIVNLHVTAHATRPFLASRWWQVSEVVCLICRERTRAMPAVAHHGDEQRAEQATGAISLPPAAHVAIHLCMIVVWPLYKQRTLSRKCTAENQYVPVKWSDNRNKNRTQTKAFVRMVSVACLRMCDLTRTLLSSGARQLTL